MKLVIRKVKEFDDSLHKLLGITARLRIVQQDLNKALIGMETKLNQIKTEILSEVEAEENGDDDEKD